MSSQVLGGNLKIWWHGTLINTRLGQVITAIRINMACQLWCHTLSYLRCTYAQYFACGVLNKYPHISSNAYIVKYVISKSYSSIVYIAYMFEDVQIISTFISLNHVNWVVVFINELHGETDVTHTITYKCCFFFLFSCHNQTY